MSRTFSAGFMLFLLLGVPRASEAGVILTGTVVYSANPNGSFYNQEFWNTYGGDFSWNLYVTQPNSGLGGGFLNSGNASSTRISYDLAPGTYTFHTFGESGTVSGGNPTDYFGLNLFFNSNDATPAISVFAPADHVPGSPDPAVAVNNHANSISLQITNASASGSMNFSDGQYLVSLTDFVYSLPSVNNLNRVSQYTDGPNTTNDYVGRFTLTVTAVPEPGTIILITMSIATLAFASRRRKHGSGGALA